MPSPLCRSQGRLFRLTPSLNFSVYLKGQNPARDAASHKTSHSTAKLVLEAGLARPIGQRQIQLKTDESWKSIKARVRPADGCLALLPPLDFYMAYNFPLPYSFLRMYENRLTA